VLIGFDLRGQVREQMKDGTVKSRDMVPEETVWYQYEKLFTSNWQLLSEHPEYIKYLQSYIKGDYEGVENMPYRRLWTREINTYAHNYNHLDISLAPLVESKFNLFKSQLKVVEAGFHKKALIAQNFGAYLDLTNIFDGQTVNPKGNAILIDSRKNHKQWKQSVKRLIDNPEIMTMMGENLNELVHERFDLKKVTKTRAEFYRSIL
jgi:glycosyltransferase involved in cell wall biosynthesis